MFYHVLRCPITSVQINAAGTDEIAPILSYEIYFPLITYHLVILLLFSAEIVRQLFYTTYREKLESDS